MSRRQPDTVVEPVVQRLRIRYAKRDRLRFASHRDFARALERAIRRAGLPIAHSAGFTPHPKVSYVGAAPTGAASEAEYAELGLARPVEPAAARTALDAALPPGLDVLAVVEVTPGEESLADRIDASRWRIELAGVTVADLTFALQEFDRASAAPVPRRTKSGTKSIDVRSAVVSWEVRSGAPSSSAPDPCAILDLVVRHTIPAARPDDVLAALRALADLVPPSPARATRLAQGRLGHDGRLADPFAPASAAPVSVTGGTESDVRLDPAPSLRTTPLD